MLNSFKDNLETELGKNRIKKNFNLSPYLTLRTKTTAEYYFEAETKDDLVNAKKASLEYKIPLTILGGGSNLAVLKNRIEGLVVRNKYLYKKTSSK